MKQTSAFISTYTADTMGVCSALFELGGMCVMHDASGCNSTYNTHDEPRWYDMDSMVYISALSETEAIMGDDDKLIDDVIDAAVQLHPKFIALAGSPIPMVIGTDLKAIAAVIEKRTGIPSMGFPSNGMRSYLCGAGEAFAALAERFVGDTAERTDRLSVNILGLTPLDFSVNGSAEDIIRLLKNNDIDVVSSWAMGSSPEDISRSGTAHVNLVVSYAGLAAAERLKRKFGTPYVTGVPYGEDFSRKVIADIQKSAQSGEYINSYVSRDVNGADTVIIGESVTSGSLAAAMTAQSGKPVKVLCPIETKPELMTAADAQVPDETDIAEYLKNAKTVIADPLYQPIIPRGANFISLPSEAFSGRIYRDHIPNFIGCEIKF